MPGSESGDLLVAYGHTDASRQAAAFVAVRAARTGESVDVVYVGTDRATEEIRDAVDDVFADRGVEYRVETIDAPGAEHDNVSVSEALVAFVRRHDYELVAMGNEKHGLVHALTQASVSSDLIDARLVPVVLVPDTGPAERGEPGTVLVAYDDTPACRRAARFAAVLVARGGGAVEVVHVGPELTTREMRDAVLDEFVDRGVEVGFETVRASGSDDDNVSVRGRLSRHVGENDYELVVMGNEKHGLLHALVERSVSGALIEDQTVPVALVP